MADRTPDSSGGTSGGNTPGTTPAGLPTTPSVDSPAPDGGSPSPTHIPVAEHEAALASERKRRSGQERSHQKEVAGLRADLEVLKSQVASLPASPLSRSGTDRLKALVQQLDNGGTVSSEVIREVVLAVDAWSSYFDRQRQDEERRRAIQTVVEEAVEDLADLYPGQTIPRSVLDLSSPETVRVSAKEYLQQRRIDDLERTVGELTGRTSQAEQEAAVAATRTRQQLGATQTLTSTGSAPNVPSEVQEELAEVNGQIERAKRQRRGPDVMALNRRKEQLEAEMAATSR